MPAGKKDKRGGQTFFQERAAGMASFARSHIPEKVTTQQVMALGARLMVIVYQDRSEEFKTQTRDAYNMAMEFFTQGLHGRELVLKYMRERANIFEHNNQPKQADLCRALSFLARVDLDIPNAVLACVKAVRAGGDPDQIKTAIMLIF